MKFVSKHMLLQTVLVLGTELIFVLCSPQDEEIQQPCDCPLVIWQVCGNDGYTYNNECAAKCAGAEVVSEGECGSEARTCDCPFVAEPVCGTDQNTYISACAATCEEVEIMHDGECNDEIDGASPPPPPIELDR